MFLGDAVNRKVFPSLFEIIRHFTSIIHVLETCPVPATYTTITSTSQL